MLLRDQRGASSLIGRDAEVAQLEQELASVVRGQRRIIEVAGEPGIGKTRLLAELIKRADFRGAATFSVSARNADWYGRFGCQANAYPVRPAEVADRVVEVIDRCSSKGPVVVAIDDLHHADDATVELMARLARQAPGRTALTAVAYRPRQLHSSLAILLEEGRRHGVTRQLTLDPLSERDVGQLLGSHLGGVEQAERYRAAGGNPLYLQALRDDDLSALLTDLAGIGDQARGVILAATVAEEPVDPEMIAHLTGLTEHVVFDALDELSAHDLLRGNAFRHPLLRQAIYESAPRSWARGAHARAEEFLAGKGEPVTARADHVARSAPAGDISAVKLLAEAAAKVEHTAPAKAAEWYEAALGLNPPREMAGRLHYGLGYTLGLSGRLDRACEHYRDGLAQLLPGDPLRRRAAAMAATAERMLGRLAESSEILDSELAQGEVTGPSAVPVLLELACHGFIRRQLDGHRRYAELAHADACARGDRSAQAAAAILLCAACCEQPDVPRARGYLAEAQRIADAFTDAQAITMLSLFVALGCMEIWTDDYQAAVRHLVRGTRLARQTGQHYVLSSLMTQLAEAYLCLGRLKEARQSATDAFLSAGHDQDRILALCRQSEIDLWIGDGPAALRAAEEAAAIGDAFKDWASDIARSHLSAIRAFTGEPGAAEVFRSAAEDPGLTALSPLIRPRGYSFLVSAAVLTGHHKHAQEWAARAQASAKGLGMASADGHAHLARAAAAIPADETKALWHARRAAECFRRIGARLNMARAALTAGEALAATHDTTRAAEQFHDAERMFRAVGAVGLADFTAWRRAAILAAQEPGKAGAAAQRPAGASPESAPSDMPLDRLTPRERQVAGCIAEGHGNRQIARQLGLREKTVEVHVTHIMRKLGVLSRAGVAGIVARAER